MEPRWLERNEVIVATWFTLKEDSQVAVRCLDIGVSAGLRKKQYVDLRREP